ncbi:copper resistance protein B [Spongiibacter marinus]|uniref:copper resistance protein B n=1 Tax=Spongiibacter marinus TaxID=354246 RepID=UPI0035BEA1D8
MKSIKTIVFQLVMALPVTASMINVSLAGAKDDPVLTMLQFDKLEMQDGESENPLLLEGQGWIGQDLNKFWLKTEIEREDGKTEEAELQALYSKGVSPFWDFQVGIRRDFQPIPDRNWAVIGLQGLAPYFFEVDTALFIGESGRTALRVEAEYELLFTQRLILTPEIEVNLYGKNDEELGVGSGLSDIEAGLRLRYEIRREFAPYIGVSWSKSFGNTANFAREDGEDTNDIQWVIGIRTWF